VIVAMRARRGPPLRARALLAYLLLTLVIAIPIAAIRAVQRGDADAEPIVASAIDGERAVISAERALASRPDDPRALADLALAYLQRVRETADPAYYAKADDLVRRATSRDAGDPAVRIAAAGLALGRHEFASALEHARSAAVRAPKAPIVHAAIVDALVELGRYDEAVAAAQVLVDLRPDLASLSRVSYLRELHGDLEGAIDAMRRAVAAGAPHGEATAWTDVQLGHLLFTAGDLAAAERAYESALTRVDAYPYALAGIARVRVAQGELAAAASLYERVARTLPLAEHFAALGDLSSLIGDTRRAEEQYALVEATQRLFAGSGVRTDVDLALFDLDHGRGAERALAAARAEYAVRPSIHVAGALAWAEHHAGDRTSAARHIDEALRLGTKDALMLYRGAVIAADAGDGAHAADLLARARALDRGWLVLPPDLAARVARLGTP
jgi:tetratricopeptide (TPR) repeat protein